MLENVFAPLFDNKERGRCIREDFHGCQPSPSAGLFDMAKVTLLHDTGNDMVKKILHRACSHGYACA